MNFKLLEIYDAGTNGDNEVARIRLEDGTDRVQKVMLANKKYHQRRKALTEVVFTTLDALISGRRVAPNIDAKMFTISDSYSKYWGTRNSEGHNRVCEVLRSYCPGGSGIKWRGHLYTQAQTTGQSLQDVDQYIIKPTIQNSLDAEKISLLDFLTVNQDRSARNWGYDWDNKKFWAFDNGMAWFHEFPENNDWRYGCAIDDVLLQVKPWEFISGVFTTLWAGKPLSKELYDGLRQFNTKSFLENIGSAAGKLNFPKEISNDWRFKAIVDRLNWVLINKRQPTAEEYHNWFKRETKDSYLMNPYSVIENGGKIIWKLEWDKNL